MIFQVMIGMNNNLFLYCARQSALLEKMKGFIIAFPK